MTVFTRSAPLFGNQHNDIYVDDASLAAVSPDDSGGSVAPPPAPEATATTAPSELPGAIAYTVQRGDNLFRIGLRFGVSVARIKQLNGLFSDIIFVGQTLIIAP